MGMHKLETADVHDAEQDLTLIESMVSKILYKIIEDLTIFQPVYQNFKEEKSLKMKDMIENVEFCEELSSKRMDQNSGESGNTCSSQISSSVTGQDSVTDSTVNTETFNLRKILPGTPESDKTEDVDSDETGRKVIDCCEKEQLLFALQLSPAFRNNKEFNGEETHKENKKKESVHFNSPVAVVYVLTGSSEAVSDASTQILSDSELEDIFSQTKYREDSEVKNEECVDYSQELNKLSILNEASQCMKGGIMTAGGDCFNVRLTENVASGDTSMVHVAEKVNEKNREKIRNGSKTIVIPDSPIYNEKLPETDEVYAEVKADSNSEDFLLSQNNYMKDPEVQIQGSVDSVTELNKLLDLDVEKLEGCIMKEVMTPGGDCCVFPGTSKLDDVNSERSVEKIDMADMKNTKETEGHESDEYLSVTVSKNSDPKDITTDMIVAKEKSEDISQHTTVENKTLDTETCNNVSVQVTFSEQCKNIKTLHEKQTVSSTAESPKLVNNMLTSDCTRQDDNVNEIFTKIPLKQVEQINCSQDLFVNCNQTDASKKSDSFTNFKYCMYQETAFTNENRSAKNDNQLEVIQNYMSAISDESHSKPYKNDDTINNVVKHKSMDESGDFNKQGNIIGIETNSFGSVEECSDGISEANGNKLCQAGKREQSSPQLHWSQLSKKSKSDSEEMLTTNNRKRRLSGLRLDENRNIKTLKLHSDIRVESLVNDNVPKMLKQLARDTLTDLEETVILDTSKVLKEYVKKKENTGEERYMEEAVKCCGNGYTSSQIKAIESDSEKELDENAHEPYDRNQVHINDTVSSGQHSEESQLSKSTDRADHDILQTNSAVQDCEITTVEEALLPETIAEFKENKEFDQDLYQSPGFITATELLSQSSQNSGSTGFTVTAQDLYGENGFTVTAQDLYGENGTSDDTELGLIAAVRVDETVDNLSGEQKVNSVQGQENEVIEVHCSKTKNIVEITEDGFKEERLEDEVHGITLSGSVKRNIEVDDSKQTVTDQDEQIDTDQLDMYVDNAVDQVVPDEDAELTERPVETDTGKAVYINGDNTCQKLKLYACDTFLCDEQGSPLCIPVNKLGKTYEKCFNWKYRPSCDLDLDNDVPVPELPDEDHVVRITPLKTCGKPLRLGLSKRQPVKSSLHKLGIRK